jgi:hypothetical protein
MDRGAEKDARVDRRLSAVPTLVWMMLGLLLILAFIGLLVFVFHAPPSWKASRSLGPPRPMPSSPQQAAPATPAPAPDSSDVSR